MKVQSGLATTYKGAEARSAVDWVKNFDFTTQKPCFMAIFDGFWATRGAKNDGF